ncbi:MAG: formylglycine-generating enzyme family protein [Candidatus Marinimicrobia bacterium]|nr:formylglycine-generating enzyme family protein [Candidatus Neomarinimicrobiota bacterium]
MSRDPCYSSASGGNADAPVIPSYPAWRNRPGSDTSRFPVEYVSWYDAVEFCNKLSVKEQFTPYYKLQNVERKAGRIVKAKVTITEGNGYRLPTEAEWEYACRAGTTTPFHFGSTSNGRKSNIDGNYPFGTKTKGPYLKRTTTVGSYTANTFGLHDMHGNVWEWCQDRYDKEYYAKSPRVDPEGPSTGVSRVGRGGSWGRHARFCRSALRNWLSPGLRNYDLGFRAALVPSE